MMKTFLKRTINHLKLDTSIYIHTTIHGNGLKTNKFRFVYDVGEKNNSVSLSCASRIIQIEEDL